MSINTSTLEIIAPLMAHCIDNEVHTSAPCKFKIEIICILMAFVFAPSESLSSLVKRVTFKARIITIPFAFHSRVANKEPRIINRDNSVAAKAAEL